MGRPKKDTTKEKRLWVRCTEEQYNQIQSWADEKKVSMGDILISKAFNIDIIPVPEEKECTYYLDNKKGEPRPYKLTYKTKKRGILKPVESE